MVGIAKQVYCVSCNELVPREQATLVFRTGFYRGTYPLCLCGACRHPELEEDLELAAILEAMDRYVMEGHHQDTWQSCS